MSIDILTFYIIYHLDLPSLAQEGHKTAINENWHDHRSAIRFSSTGIYLVLCLGCIGAAKQYGKKIDYLLKRMRHANFFKTFWSHAFFDFCQYDNFFAINFFYKCAQFQS